MNSKWFVRGAGAVALCASLIVGPALAQDAAATVAARQGKMKALGGDMQAVRGAVTAPTPDWDAAKAAVAKVQASADGIPSWFPKGTGPESGAKTRAKPEIWSDSAGFDTAAKNFKGAVDKLAGAVNAGDAEGAKAAMGAVMGGCGGCHTPYRGPPVA